MSRALVSYSKLSKLLYLLSLVSAKSRLVVRILIKKILQLLPALDSYYGDISVGRTSSNQTSMFWHLFQISNRNHYFLPNWDYVIFGPFVVIGVFYKFICQIFFFALSK